jgi:hypothetical protein
MVRNENRKNYGEINYIVNKIRIIKNIDSFFLRAVNIVLKLEEMAELRNRRPEEKI